MRAVSVITSRTLLVLGVRCESSARAGRRVPRLQRRTQQFPSPGPGPLFLTMVNYHGNGNTMDTITIPHCWAHYHTLTITTGESGITMVRVIRGNPWYGNTMVRVLVIPRHVPAHNRISACAHAHAAEEVPGWRVAAVWHTYHSVGKVLLGYS